MDELETRRLTLIVELLAIETSATIGLVVDNLIGILWNEEEAGQIKFYAQHRSLSADED